MKNKTDFALLFDYEFCSGCHTCEVACQKEHGFAPDVFGIILTQIGPIEHAPKRWQYDNIPMPTDLCDHCASRIEKGKEPTCVKHCQAGIITFGKYEDLVKDMKGTHEVLFTIA